jgi:hypothetical protein
MCAGYFASWLAAYLVAWVMGWRRPVQDWLTGVGLGSVAPHYGLLNIELPTIALALIGGSAIGRLAPHRPLLLASTFAFGLALMPHLFDIWMPRLLGRPGWVPTDLHTYAVTVIVTTLAAIVPTLASAWLVSARPRLQMSRKTTGKCVRCGYDLRGCQDSRCPECGTVFEPATGTESASR